MGTKRTSLRQWSMIRIPEYVIPFESLREMALYVFAKWSLAVGNMVIDNCKARTAFGFAVLPALAIICCIDLLY